MAAPDVKSLVERCLIFHMPQIPAIISSAYQAAHDMGRRGNDYLYSPALEKERIAYEQGRSVQEALFKWALVNPRLDARWEENRRRQPHAAIYAGNLHITSHRVLSRGEFPRPALYRQDNALSNIHWLPGFVPEYDPAKRVYLYLLHGPSIYDRYSVGFIQLGAPAPERNQWLYLFDIKMENMERDPIEDIPEKQLTSLKNGKVKNNAG